MTWLGIFFALGFTAAVYRASLRATATAFAIAVLYYALFGDSGILALLLVVLWAMAFVPAQLLPLRQEWVARPLLRHLKARAAASVDRPMDMTVANGAVALAGGLPPWNRWLSSPLPGAAQVQPALRDAAARGLIEFQRIDAHVRKTAVSDPIAEAWRCDAAAHARILDALSACAADFSGPASTVEAAERRGQLAAIVQRFGLAPAPVAESVLEVHARLLPALQSAVPAVAALHAAQCEPNPAKALQRFDDALQDDVAMLAQALARALLLGLSGSRLLSPPALGPLAGAFGRVSRYSAVLATLIALLPWSRSAARMALPLGRAWGALCAAAALLRVFELQGRPPADVAVTRHALALLEHDAEDALNRAREAVTSVWLSRLLRLCLFPLGRAASAIPAPVTNL